MDRSNFPDEYIGKEVVVIGGHDSEWRGTAVGYRREPSVLIEQKNGHRLMLPANNVRLVVPPKPWHAAKDGEIWEVHPRFASPEPRGVVERINGEPATFVDPRARLGGISVTSVEILHARRIWPEVE